MSTSKPAPGESFSTMTLPKLGGGTVSLGSPTTPDNWQLIVVYRGKHCPVCTRYLTEIGEIAGELNRLGIDVVAISSDSEERAKAQITEAGVQFDIGYGLSVEQMKNLGLYISSPRHGMNAEVPFAEPGMFLVDETGELRMVDIANVPFLRPQIKSILMGLKFMRGMTEKFPANGTYA